MGLFQMKTKHAILQKLGGHFQLAIDSADDLAYLFTLDEAHWMATIVPTDSLVCDKALVAVMDSDKSGSIRSEELKEAWDWISSILSEKRGITERSKELLLDWIDTSTERGKAIHATAQQVLANLKVEDATKVTLGQITDRHKILSSAKCNGDGVIPPESCENEENRKFIEDVVKTCGGVEDLSKKSGVDETNLKTFEERAKAYVEWHAKGLIPDDSLTTDLMVRGNDTKAHADAIAAVQEKLDEYFRLCRLVRLAPASAECFESTMERLSKLDVDNPDAVDEYVKKASLAKPNPDEVLLLHKAINPLYADAVKTLVDTCFGDERDAITRDEWLELKNEFADYRAWNDAKAGAEVEPLGLETITAYLEGDVIGKVREMIAADKAVANEIAGIADLEKLLLLQAWILDLANNFVSFNQLFDPTSKSLIQVGKLIMDGRHFDFCVRATDRAKHRKIADRSNICTMYLQCRRKEGESEETMEIATAVTSGNMVYLYVGKLGVFLDTDGKKWDAEVLDVITHPVSVTEALKMPFRKLGDFIKKQSDKFTANRYDSLETGLGKKLTEAEKKLATPKPAKPAPQPAKSGNLSFLMLGGGLSIAAIGSAFGYVTKALKGVSLGHVFMVLGSILLIIGAPIVIVALVKLRKRNLGIFLEAGGWAINAPLRLTHRMGLLFTRQPDYPDGSEFRRFDLMRSLLKKASVKPTKARLVWLTVLLILATSFCAGYFLREPVMAYLSSLMPQSH